MVYFIFTHFTRSEKINNKDVISNRCYLGFSLNNDLYSFVHGNTLAKYTSISKSKKFSSDIIKTSLFENYSYTIQKFFKGFDKNELFFINPTSKK